jgi:hypothetical protein
MRLPKYGTEEVIEIRRKAWCALCIIFHEEAKKKLPLTAVMNGEKY